MMPTTEKQRSGAQRSITMGMMLWVFLAVPHHNINYTHTQTEFVEGFALTEKQTRCRLEGFRRYPPSTAV